MTPDPWGTPGGAESRAGDGEREWVLARAEPVQPARGAAFALLLWVPGALGAVAWETHTLTTRSWPAVVNLTSLIALLAAGWTGIGVAVLRKHVEGHRGDVLTAGPRGVRAERRTREGRRLLFEVGYDDIRDVADAGDRLRLETSDGTKYLTGTGSHEQRDEIVDLVRARTAPRCSG